GVHTVHFRMAVNTVAKSDAALVRIDVNDKGNILASRDIRWNQFSFMDMDFSLSFTNSTAGNPLEFRVYWNHAKGLAALTLVDVTIGGAQNWTAANLQHDLGRLDAHDSWVADRVQVKSSGFLTKGAATDTLKRGDHVALFELKVDNFNWD